MRAMSLALVAALVLAGAAAQAQTAMQPAGATAPATSPSETGKPHLSHDCKEEVKKECGRAHGDEMQKCVKAGLDLNKFSAACKTELTQSAKPSG